MTNFIEHVNRQNDLVKQVMGEDIQRRTFERYLQEFRTENMLFPVLRLNDYLAKDKEPYRIQKFLKKYFRDVDNEVFSKKSNKRLQRGVVIENLKKVKFYTKKKLHNKNHIQLAIECPKHLNKIELRKIMKRNTNNRIVSLEHCEDVHDLRGLSNYNTKDMKDIKPNETDITFDEVNSYKIH